MYESELAEVVERFRTLPALEAKSSLRLVAEVFGESDWVTGPGDDTAVIEAQGENLLLAGEAIWPPFVEADPFGAGVACVVANVNDIAAMGGRGIALVDQVVASRETATKVLEGIRLASDLYRLPVAGGHLTIWEGAPSVAASILGRAARPLSAVKVAPGQKLLVACCLEGHMRPDFPFYSSINERGARLAGDVAILADLAEAGLMEAAKDVSMPGILGSLAMLLEATGCGAIVDLEALPRPEGVPLAAWSFAFPNFAFLLCARPSQTSAVRKAFAEVGLACEGVGSIDETGRLRVKLRREEAGLLDLRSETVTGLVRRPGPAPPAGSPSSGGGVRGTRPAPPPASNPGGGRSGRSAAARGRS